MPIETATMTRRYVYFDSNHTADAARRHEPPGPPDSRAVVHLSPGDGDFPVVAVASHVVYTSACCLVDDHPLLSATARTSGVDPDGLLLIEVKVSPGYPCTLPKGRGYVMGYRHGPCGISTEAIDAAKFHRLTGVELPTFVDSLPRDRGISVRFTETHPGVGIRALPFSTPPMVERLRLHPGEEFTIPAGSTGFALAGLLGRNAPSSTPHPFMRKYVVSPTVTLDLAGAYKAFRGPGDHEDAFLYGCTASLVIEEMPA